MKILFVIGDLKYGGAERVVTNLVNSLCEYEHNIYVLVFNDGETDYKISNKAKIIIANKNTRNKFTTFFSTIKYIRRLLKEVKTDVVVSFLSDNNIYTLISSLGLKKKIIISERNDPHKTPSQWYYRFLRKIMYPLSNGFVFQTDDAKKYFPKKIQNKSVIIENPVALHSKDFKDIYNDSPRNIVTVGRLSKQKNQLMLINVFSRLIKLYPEISLTIYGVGELKNQLKAAIHENNLKSKIILMGKERDLISKLKDYDLFVLNSNFEGIPNALLEAMSVGLPCISTDCPIGGPRSLIDDQINGILIPVQDEDKLFEAIKKVIDTKNLAQNLGTEAKKVNIKYNIEKITFKWLEYIESII
jgi:glycosyltransferase involved in cell wall biosynthesis